MALRLQSIHRKESWSYLDISLSATEVVTPQISVLEHTNSLLIHMTAKVSGSVVTSLALVNR